MDFECRDEQRAEPSVRFGMCQAVAPRVQVLEHVLLPRRGVAHSWIVIAHFSYRRAAPRLVVWFLPESASMAAPQSPQNALPGSSMILANSACVRAGVGGKERINFIAEQSEALLTCDLELW